MALPVHAEFMLRSDVILSVVLFHFTAALRPSPVSPTVTSIFCCPMSTAQNPTHSCCVPDSAPQKGHDWASIVVTVPWRRGGDEERGASTCYARSEKRTASRRPWPGEDGVALYFKQRALLRLYSKGTRAFAKRDLIFLCQKKGGFMCKTRYPRASVSWAVSNTDDPDDPKGE